MRKRTHGFLVLMLVVLSFAAAPLVAEGAPETDDPLKPVTVATGPAGGMYQGLGGVISDKANELAGTTVFGITSGGSVTSIPVVGNNEAGIGVTLTPFLVMAQDGSGPFDGQTFPNLRALFVLLPTQHYFLVNPRLGVSNYRELVEKKPRIIFGGAGRTSPSFWIVEDILGFYGAGHAAMQDWGAEVLLQSTSENVSSWNDGRSDIFNTNSLFPASSITQATSTRRGVFWDIPEEVMPLLEARGYRAAVIPAGSYPGQDKDYHTVGANTAVFANTDVSEEAAYYFTKAFVEAQDRLASTVSSGFVGWDVREMMEGAGIEFHEGAKRYYREMGWMQ